MKKQTIIAALISVLLLGGAFFIATQNLSRDAQSSGGRPGSVSGAPAAGQGGQAGQAGQASPAGPASQTSQAGQSTVVETDIAVQQELQGNIRLNGEIRAEESAVAYPDIAGTLNRILVTPGQYVREGQNLATVDPSRPGAQFEDSPVEAPLSGYVTAVHLDRGTSVSTSSGVATVATLDNLELVVEVPERYAMAVRPGMSGTFTSFALGDETYEARVVEMEPVLDAQTRSKEVRLEVVGDVAELQPGMFIRLSLPVRSSGRVVTVPFGALVQEAGKAYVYTVVDGSAERREVQVGLIAEEYAEVSGGLEAGAEVVVNGVQKVKENEAVRTAKAAGEERE